MSRTVVMAGWDDVPHLSDSEKKRLLESYPVHLREARSKGIPSLGAGAIYPIELEDVVVDDFEIPKHWPRGYGLDVGWKATAAVWGAWDRDNDIIYLYREYKRGQAEPASHALAIGKKVWGAIDPASRGCSQRDGKRLMVEYEELGLTLVKADNAVEAGLFECYQRYTTGKLKMFRSLVQTQGEMRLYRRDEKGKIVKQNDHLMDAKRYLVLTRDQVMIWAHGDDDDESRRGRGGAGSWMGS